MGRPQGSVDDANVTGVLWARRRTRCRVEVRLAAVVECNVLLGDQAGANAGAKVLVKEACYLSRAYIAATFQEAAGQNRNGVGMRCDKLSKNLGEADLVVEGANGVVTALVAFCPPGK